MMVVLSGAPVPDTLLTFGQRVYESRHLIPVVLLISGVLGSIYSGVATATEAAAIGVVGSLVLSLVQGSLNWATFRASLLGAFGWWASPSLTFLSAYGMHAS